MWAFSFKNMRFVYVHVDWHAIHYCLFLKGYCTIVYDGIVCISVYKISNPFSFVYQTI